MNLIEQRTREYFGERFAEFLKKWMTDNQKTQKDFCAAAEVSKNIVTAWKRGERLPRDAQMMKICDVFGIDQRAFEPSFPLEKDWIDNSVTEEWSNQLQQYASKKGLDDKWFQYFISKPQFLRRFPFENPPVVKTTETEFELVKYEFKDDAGNRIRMTKGDIDFLIKVQNKSAEMIDYQMYKQKQRNEKKRVERLVDLMIKPYDGINRAEVLSRLYSIDLTKTDQRISDKEIYDTIEQIAKEKGKRPHYSKTEVIDGMISNNPLYDDEWKKSWREWGRINNQAEQAEKIIREAEENTRRAAGQMIEKLRSAGILDEETEV